MSLSSFFQVRVRRVGGCCNVARNEDNKATDGFEDTTNNFGRIRGEAENDKEICDENRGEENIGDDLERMEFSSEAVDFLDFHEEGFRIGILRLRLKKKV